MSAGANIDKQSQVTMVNDVPQVEQKTNVQTADDYSRLAKFLTAALSHLAQNLVRGAEGMGKMRKRENAKTVDG
jgi:N-acetylglutamate synthase/N-acetylornithine aminotransferase